MIEITTEETEIRVTGHAGFGPPGRDIVCAGVSTLFQNLIWSIEELISDKIEYGISPGYSWVRHNKDLSEEAILLIESFFIGVNGIADAYPECVAVFGYKSNGTDVGRVGAETERKEI